MKQVAVNSIDPFRKLVRSRGADTARVSTVPTFVRTTDQSIAQLEHKDAEKAQAKADKEAGAAANAHNVEDNKRKAAAKKAATSKQGGHKPPVHRLTANAANAAADLLAEAPTDSTTASHGFRRAVMPSVRASEATALSSDDK